MVKKYKYAIIIDTEFVSSKEGAQPFQISMLAFKIENSKLVKLNDFNAFIMLRKGLKLNYFAKKCTGITDEKLKENGIYPDMATHQVINYLLMFNIEETIIIGWAPSNDKRMLDLLINHEEPLIDLEAFDWFDLSKSYLSLNKIETKETPSLSSVINFYHLRGYSFHDSMEDARATATLFCLFLKEYGIDKTIYDCMQKPKKAKDKRKNIKDATSQ